MSRGTDKADAVRALLASVKLVRFVLGLGIKDGRVALRPEILTWMEAKEHRPSAVFVFGENEAAELGGVSAEKRLLVLHRTKLCFVYPGSRVG